jgi:hypothetical protein
MLWRMVALGLAKKKANGSMLDTENELDLPNTIC